MTSSISNEPISPLTGVDRIVETRLPTRHGEFAMVGYEDHLGVAHVAITVGLDDETLNGEPVLVRIHSECLTGDALGSHRCDCGDQLDAALARIAQEGRGAVIYVRGHEGRGIGLLEKLRAYALQDRGMDTVDANLELGHPADARSYEQSAHILADLSVTAVRLLSNNPAKQEALEALGVRIVDRVALGVADRPDNARYLATKRTRMRHDEPLDLWERLLDGDVPTLRDDPLVQLYGPLVTAGPDLVIAQLGQSLDGFIASRTGDAEFVTGPEDRLRLHRMRALVDAVVVGASTVIADDPRLTVRDCAGDDPVRVVVDPQGRIPLTAHVLREADAPTLWLVGPDVAVPDSLPAHVTTGRLATAGPTDPAELLALLADRGLTRVLIEGGGRLVSAFVAAGEVDRLYLTTAPVLIGDGVPGLRFDGTDVMAEALRGPVRRFALGEDVCTEILLQAGSTS
ncbi:GTP cyclohydrolase II [Ammonicoccus fulvus]|uniref:GTP cyclohydrolase-2 n=1 Tax=Ammonicoccus fulvus TaxID=3138240 RepID=A0ABZ3FVU9_9ACTN